MLRDSTAAGVVVVRTRPRAIPLAMVHMRKSIHGFPSVPLYGYGAPLGGLWPPELCYKAPHIIQVLLVKKLNMPTMSKKQSD